MPPSRTSSTKPSDGACVADSVPRRVSVRATSSQLAELTRFFQDNPRPSEESKDALAERTGLRTKWISDWFTRKRKKVYLESISNNSGIRVNNATPDAFSPQTYRAPLVSEATVHNSASTAQTDRSSTSPTSRAASTIPSDWAFTSMSPPTASFASSNAGANFSPSIPVSTLHLINTRLLQNHTRFLQPQVAQRLQTSIPPAYTPDPHSVSTATIIPNALILASVLAVPGTAAENNTNETPRLSSSPRLALNFPPYVPHTSHFVAIPTLPHPPSFYTHPSPPSYHKKLFGLHQDFVDRGSVEEDTESMTTSSDFTDYLQSKSDVPESLDAPQEYVGEGGVKEEVTLSGTVDSDPTCASGLANTVLEGAANDDREMKTKGEGVRALVVE